MERSIALEENRDKAVAVHSMESSKTDSISVDIIDANEKKDVGKCEHFTIRGYVSETRKRDWKRCWPFASESNEYEEQKCSLPPLHVPNFRFWRCENCQWTIDGNISPSLYEAIEVHSSLCVDGKEKKSKVASKPIIAQNTQVEENLHKEVPGFSSAVMEAVSGMVPKAIHTDDQEAALVAKCDQSTKLCKPDSGHLADSEFHKNPNGAVVLINAIGQTGKENSLNDQEKQLIPCGRSPEASNAEGALSADKDVIDRGPSLESECTASSSESSENENELQDLQDDEPRCLRPRKTRKMRLLTELLGEHRDADTDHNKTEDSASNAIPGASGGSLNAAAGANKPPVTQHQLANQGTSRKILSQSRKRKLPLDEDWRPPETSSPNKVPNEVRFLKRDSENANAVVLSVSKANASARISLQTDLKHHGSKRKIDKVSTEGKKKNKMTMVFNESLSSLLSEKNVPNDIGNKRRDNNKGNGIDGVFLKQMDDSFTGREMDLFPLTAERKERNLGNSKKKGKMPQDDDQQASIVPWHHDILSESPMTRKDVENVPCVLNGIPFNAVGETSRERGLNLSLNSYMATERYDGKCIPLVEDRQASFLAWQNSTSGGQAMRKAPETEYIGDFSFPSSFAANASSRSGLDGNLSTKRPAYMVPFINEKQNHTSQVEVGGSPLMQHKDFFSTGSHGKAISTQEHAAATERDNSQNFGKSSEQGALDDIPMDIVELMAKNQYERCQPDAECDKLPLATNDNPKRGQTSDCSNTHELGELSLFQQESTQKQMRGLSDGRDGKMKRAEIVGTAKEKTLNHFSHVDRNRLNISQLEQTHVPTGFRTSFQHQEIPLNGFQYFASSSQGQSNTKNCKRTGDISGKPFHHNILQASRTCNSCHHSPRQDKEANQILSSTTPSLAPLVCKIPQKFAAPPNGMDALSCMAGDGSMPMGKKNGGRGLRFTQSATNVGKQLRNFSPDILTRTQAEHPLPGNHYKLEPSQKPVGQLDLYSNDTIPAMHLLSLVDAEIRSTTPINMELPAEFLRRPPINHEPCPSHISRPVPAAYKASNAMNDMSCHCKNQLAGDSHDGITAIPATVAASSSSPKRVNSFRKAIDFTARHSLEKEKRKGSDMHFQNKDRSQKSVSAGCGFGSTCGSIPVHSMQTIFFGTPEQTMFPSHFRALDNLTNQTVQVPSTSGTVQPHKGRPEDQICSLNRNPADFSTPDDKNEYMIKGEDLKIREGILTANRSHSLCVDVDKRRGKRPIMKEGCI